MLDNLRPSAASLPAKIMLVMLVLTFAVWGVGDIIRNPGKSQAVATVGSQKITAEEFIRQMKIDAERMKEAMGDNFNPDMMKSPSMSRRVLNKLVNDRLATLHAEELGLVASDVDVVRRIRSIPAFQDEKGNFDKSLFEATLRKNNINEATYAERLRRDMNVSFLINTLSWRAPVLDATYQTFYEMIEESRNITLYLLKPSMVPEAKPADADKLRAYYDAHAISYMSPEYRTVSYVTITRDLLAKDAKIPDEELQAAYKERIEEFKKPEIRQVQQLLFTSEDAAKKAHDLLKQGKSIEQVSNEAPVLNKKALDLGKVEKKNIFESAADKVFSLEKGQFSEPVQSPFGWHIFRVSSIEPAKTLSFEEAKPSLEKEAAAHYADKLLSELVNKFQDALAGGSTFAEAAGEFKLKLSNAGPFDSTGMSPDNTKAAVPDYANFTELSFKTDEKNESSASPVKGGGYFIVHVDKITPERQRSFEEVKAKVADDIKKEDSHQKLAEISKEVGDKFASAATRKEVIASFRLQPLQSGTVKLSSRTIDKIEIPPQFLKEVFSLKAGGGTHAHVTATGEYLLATLDSVVPAAKTEGNPKLFGVYKQVRKVINARVRDEILDQYMQVLAKRYPVKIDDNALAAVLQ